ncbi:ribosomal protein LX RplX [Methanobrevibacter ruminantium M1]|uniref:Large ribosomal subunit protein eL20 n=1 Tax=Methanobrevibacter ruminantium (strain ATCC 35063 / DSM 1093 / JCM 13430 / OCM 146 / M1) TaxID=634498 RepID=D3E0K8_METRM|nr:50S ribosomal protein L18Ae [Methanobrevibacter ruminantium]ADC46254.1 ribosomal protein LX RplX [Methanobrevibacter ruminantium M1]
MITKNYRVKGSFVMGSETQVFTKELRAIKEEDIYEKLYSIFGSKHRIKRNQIKIDSIEEISDDEVEDPIVQAIL